jgi:hypothetical protein
VFVAGKKLTDTLQGIAAMLQSHAQALEELKLVPKVVIPPASVPASTNQVTRTLVETVERLTKSLAVAGQETGGEGEEEEGKEGKEGKEEKEDKVSSPARGEPVTFSYDSSTSESSPTSSDSSEDSSGMDEPKRRRKSRRSKVRGRRRKKKRLSRKALMRQIRSLAHR